MPTADQHRNKAESNRRFLGGISREAHLDWVVVAAFYTAVHAAERLRASLGHGHSQGHGDRLEYIQQLHPDIHTAYHILQNAAWLARYQSNADFYRQFQTADVDAVLLGSCLMQVEQHVSARCSPAAN